MSAVGVLRRVLWFVGVPLVAFVSGIASFSPVFVMGLVVPIFVVGPLALLSGAGLATLSAGWLANLANWGRDQSRLLAIFGASCAGTLLALLPYWVTAWFVNILYPPTERETTSQIFYVPYLAGALFFAAVTTLAVWWLRHPVQRGLTRSFGLTLLLAASVPAFIAGAIALGCNLTYCGA